MPSSLREARGGAPGGGGGVESNTRFARTLIMVTTPIGDSSRDPWLMTPPPPSGAPPRAARREDNMSGGALPAREVISSLYASAARMTSGASVMMQSAPRATSARASTGSSIV